MLKKQTLDLAKSFEKWSPEEQRTRLWEFIDAAYTAGFEQLAKGSARSHEYSTFYQFMLDSFEDVFVEKLPPSKTAKNLLRKAWQRFQKRKQTRAT